MHDACLTSCHRVLIVMSLIVKTFYYSADSRQHVIGNIFSPNNSHRVQMLSIFVRIFFPQLKVREAVERFRWVSEQAQARRGQVEGQ